MFVGAKLATILCLLAARTTFLLALIISHFVFVINLVWRLFTFYLFLLDGKRAPTAIGRGSFPRSRTGCDIFSFGSHVDCFTGGYGSWLFRRLMWFIQTATEHFQYQS